MFKSVIVALVFGSLVFGGMVTAQTLSTGVTVADLSSDAGWMSGVYSNYDHSILGPLTATFGGSHAVGENDWLSASRTYFGVGPGIRVGNSRIQVFGHVLVGALWYELTPTFLNPRYWKIDGVKYGESYGGGNRRILWKEWNTSRSRLQRRYECRTRIRSVILACKTGEDCARDARLLGQGKGPPNLRKSPSRASSPAERTALPAQTRHRTNRPN